MADEQAPSVEWCVEHLRRRANAFEASSNTYEANWIRGAAAHLETLAAEIERLKRTIDGLPAITQRELDELLAEYDQHVADKEKLGAEVKAMADRLKVRITEASAQVAELPSDGNKCFLLGLREALSIVNGAIPVGTILPDRERELLEANNRYLERARKAEAEIAEMHAKLDDTTDRALSAEHGATG